MSNYSSVLSGVLEQLSRDNTLIHLDIVKPRGQFIKLKARVISVDTEKDSILLYDVDGKRVENVYFSEVDEINFDTAAAEQQQRPNRSGELIWNSNSNILVY